MRGHSQPPPCYCLAPLPVRRKRAPFVKAAAWRIGDDLSLAGLYAQGGEDENLKELLARIKPLAEAMQVEVNPFPPQGRNPDQDAAVIEYLIKGNGAEIGQHIP